MRTSTLLGAIICAYVLLFGFGCTSEKKPVNQTIAYLKKDSTWQQFRGQFKYHIQTIGVTDIYSDESVAIILSEPPPNVSISDLHTLFAGYKFSIDEKTNKVGYDGWVKDLLIVISGVNEKRLGKLVDNLNRFIYSTAYKPYSIPLPVKERRNNFLGNLNFKINVSELEKWFFTDQAKFFYEDDSTLEYSLSLAFANNKAGILYSKEPGFVMWLLKEGDNISDRKETIRRFALDADLVLGAIKNVNGTIAIIGRERINNLYDLPPLRTETIMMLASANKEQLSQSYERMSLFAGKMDGGMDWAPIYLSPELLNTEYGSLLNITDQMLKSWSSNGNVDYIDFNYPKPSYYSFSKSIMEVMNTSTLTFNWNTKGAGYTIEKGDNDFYCINRTGSLPVTYIPEGLVQFDKYVVDVCEKKAYDYFSWLSNPDLVRVVQYASLYQIFSRYNINAYYYQSNFQYNNNNKSNDGDTKTTSASNSEISVSDSTSTVPTSARPLKSHVLKLIAEIQSLDVEKAEAIADRIINDSPFPEQKDRLIDYFFDAKDFLNDCLSLFDYDGENQFAEIILNPREFKPYSRNDQLKMIYASQFVKNISKDWEYILPGISTADLKNEYVSSMTSSAGPWIKTSSIVLSWDTRDSLRRQGGHNLDAKVTRFRVSDEVTRGEMKMVEEGGIKTILVSSNDISNIDPNILRKISTAKELPDHLYISDNNYVARNVYDVFPNEGKRIARGFSGIRVEEIAEGFTINGKQVKDCEELVQELTSLTAENKFDLLQVHFEKMNESRAKALLKSSEIKLAGTELNQTKILNNGNLFNVNKAKYDFGKAKVIGNMADHEIVIEIPQITNTKSRARLSITGFLKDVKEKIMNTINTLLGRAGRENINFYDELVRELRVYNIRQEDILIEVDDCIICFKSDAKKNDDC